MFDVVRRVIMATTTEDLSSKETDGVIDFDTSIEAQQAVVAKVRTRKIAKPFKIKKRRSPMQRLKSRMYYRKNKNKINLSRRRQYTKSKIFGKTRKLHKRKQPLWLSKAFSKPKTRQPNKPKSVPHKVLDKLLTPGKVKQHGVQRKYKVSVPTKI